MLGGSQRILGHVGRSQWIFRDSGVPLTFSPFSPRSPRCPCSPAGPCGGRGGTGWGRGCQESPTPLPPPAPPPPPQTPLPPKFQRFPSLELLPPAGPGVLGVLRPVGTQTGATSGLGWGGSPPLFGVSQPPRPVPAPFWGLPPTHIFDVTGFTFLSLRGEAKSETPKPPPNSSLCPLKVPKPPPNSSLCPPRDEHKISPKSPKAKQRMNPETPKLPQNSPQRPPKAPKPLQNSGKLPPKFTHLGAGLSCWRPPKEEK